MNQKGRKTIIRALGGAGAVLLILWGAWRAGDWAGSIVSTWPTTTAPLPTPTPTRAVVFRPARRPVAPVTPIATATPQRPSITRDASNDATVFSPDGKLIVTGRLKGRVLAYRRRDAQIVWSTGENPSSVKAIAFSPDGALFAVATKFFEQPESSARGQIEIRSAKTFKQHSVWPVSEEPHTVCFSPDGRLLAIGYSGDMVSLRSLRTGKDVWWYRAPYLNSPGNYGTNDFRRSIAFSPDGRYIAAAGEKGCIAIWKVKGPSVAYVVAEDANQESDVHTLLFSQDGKSLWSFGSKVFCWRSPWNFSLQTRGTEVSNTKTSPRTVCMSANGEWIAATEMKEPLKVWRASDGISILPAEETIPENVAVLSFLPDGNLSGAYLTSRDDKRGRQRGELFSWNTTPLKKTSSRIAFRPMRPTPAVPGEIPLIGVWAEPQVTAVASGTRPNAPLLAGLSKKGEVFLFDPRASRRRVIAQISGRTSMVDFTEDGKRFGLIGFGDRDREQRWEWITSSPRRAIITPLKPGDNWWAALPRCVVRGRNLLVSMNNGVVTAYDAKTHSSVLTLPDYGSRLMAMSVSQSGMVAVAHYQGTTPTPPSIYSFYDLGTSVSVWDLGMKKRLYTLPHFSAVRDLEFSPDGKYLAIGSFYPALQIYDAQSGKLHRTAQFYRGGIGYLVFSDDGTILRGLGENIYQEWRVR